MDKDYKDYKEVCFSLMKKEEKLAQIGMDTFVFNPEINSLIEEISELSELKKKMEQEMEDMK